MELRRARILGAIPQIRLQAINRNIQSKRLRKLVDQGKRAAPAPQIQLLIILVFLLQIENTTKHLNIYQLKTQEFLIHVISFL